MKVIEKIKKLLTAAGRRGRENKKIIWPFLSQERDKERIHIKRQVMHITCDSSSRQEKDPINNLKK
jgi:hypothetical protein